MHEQSLLTVCIYLHRKRGNFFHWTQIFLSFFVPLTVNFLVLRRLLLHSPPQTLKKSFRCLWWAELQILCLCLPHVLADNHLEKLVNLGQVNPLLGVQFVDVAAVSVHEVQAEPHHLGGGELQVYVHDRQQRSGKQLRMNQLMNESQRRATYLEQHVLLAGREVHLVLVVIDTQVDDVCQQLLVSVNHLQLLLQRLSAQDGVNMKLQSH